MEDAPLDRLAPAHALALALHWDGASPEEIAEKLGVELAAVAPLLSVAAQKLSRLLANGRQPD